MRGALRRRRVLENFELLLLLVLFNMRASKQQASEGEQDSDAPVAREHPEA